MLHFLSKTISPRYSFAICSFLCLTLHTLAVKQSSICNTKGCKGITEKDSPIFNFCKKIGNHLNGSCCLDGNETLLGVDLNGCDVSTTTSYLHELTDVEYMSIRGSNVSCSTKNFKGMIRLSNLWISVSCNETCPGGATAWNKTTFDSCTNQGDSCHSFECPLGSECKNNGPGLFHCVCKPPNYGYKCLQEGEFPVVVFASSLTSATVVASGLLWFFTLRKKVKITNEFFVPKS